jgi:uncharacterized LabA/DUF88 family protein
MNEKRFERVGVFADVQNLYYSARHLYGKRVDFNAVLKAATDGRILVKAMAYVVRADEPMEHTFFDALQKGGWELKMKDLQTFAGGQQKGDWDVGLTVDIIRMIPVLDAVVLCSGDGDYLPLVEYLREVGVQVEVISFGRSSSGKLKEAIDKFTDMDLDPETFLRQPKSGSAVAHTPEPEPPAPRFFTDEQ